MAPSVTMKQDNSTRCEHRWVHLLGISAWCTSDSAFVPAARSSAGCHPWLMIHINSGASVVGGAVVRGSLCCPLQLALGSSLCLWPALCWCLTEVETQLLHPQTRQQGREATEENVMSGEVKHTVLLFTVWANIAQYVIIKKKLNKHRLWYWGKN